MEEKKGLIELPTVRKAYLFEKTYGTKTVRCILCEQRCEIEEGKSGKCGTRINIDGELQTMTYGDIVCCESRPVEIKPFFHFHPGKTLLTFCCPSCNLSCPWCQNHTLSRAKPRPLKARHVPISELLESATNSEDIGFCASFTEPTLLLEYCLGLFREAKAKGLVNTFVSNGYMTSEALHMLKRAGLDAINIDIKGSDAVYREYCGGKKGDEPPWRNIKDAIEMGIHVEVTHLVVTGLNDNENSIIEIVKKHLEFAGPKTPLHFTAYRPAHKYDAPPTHVSILEHAYEIAKKEGILFPYVGNVSGHKYENTYCPECGKLLLERSGFTLSRNNTSDWKCPDCGYALPVVT